MMSTSTFWPQEYSNTGNVGEPCPENAEQENEGFASSIGLAIEPQITYNHDLKLKNM